MNHALVLFCRQRFLFPRLGHIDQVNVMGKFAVVVQCVLGRVRIDFFFKQDRQFLWVVHVPVFFWRYPGEMRSNVTHRQKKRFVFFAQTAQISDRHIGTSTIEHFVVWQIWGCGAGGSESFFAPVFLGKLFFGRFDHLLGAIRICIGQLRQLFDGFTPGLRIRSRVVIDFPVTDGCVTEFAKPLRNSNRIGFSFAKVNWQRPDTKFVRSLPRHQTGS